MSSFADDLVSLSEFRKMTGIDREGLRDFYRDALVEPLEDFLTRPKKAFRYELIEIGYQIAAEALNLQSNVHESDKQTLSLFSHIIELLHSGSLIVDDIEDGSQMRRGKQALHKIYGVPIALNAGNWLYFWPLVLLQNSDLPPQFKFEALSECQKTLLLAHTGQALDIGTPIKGLNREELNDVIFKTIELKSGALAALAMKLGALTRYYSATSQDQIETVKLRNLDVISSFGSHFGQLLQIYDDTGNMTSAKNPQKRFEDLILLRPSFIWSVIAENCGPNDLALLQDRISQCDSREEAASFLEQWTLQNKIAGAAKTRAQELRTRWTNELFSQLPALSSTLKEKIDLCLERLSNAY